MTIISLEQLYLCISNDSKDAVSYDQFRAKGLPIGSEEVEVADRYIPQNAL